MDAKGWELEVDHEQSISGLAMMRDALLAPLVDADLEQQLGGSSLTLGELIDDCAQMQGSYVEAFRSLAQTWPPSRPLHRHDATVEAVRDRFATLDHELQLALAGLAGEDWQAVVARPDGTRRTRRAQLEIYAQFMLIFIAKASVYARAAGRGLPRSVATFVG
ncbi:hypothetical protein GCM10009809_01790 [Isoptericola hypogeus]|uniref:Uncharacterized protein n=2 Tax=Isoptericola hypogeus TaxID=300179 RepID=A0ABN2IPM2_9MICO